jgi:hypothetical protein
MLQRITLGAGLGLCIAAATPGSAMAQSATTAVGPAPSSVSVSVLRTGYFSPIVADLGRTSAFYHEVIGVEIAVEPPSTWDAKPWLRRLHGTPDTPIRFATARIPGRSWGIENGVRYAFARDLNGVFLVVWKRQS